MTRKELLLRDDAARATPDALEIDIRQPWYRSLPLSSVVGLDVSVDGESISPDRFVLRIEGVDYRLDELPAAWEKVWFIQDAGTIRIADLKKSAGDTIHVVVAIRLRYPYIIIDGIGPLERLTDADLTLTVKENQS